MNQGFSLSRIEAVERMKTFDARAREENEFLMNKEAKNLTQNKNKCNPKSLNEPRDPFLSLHSVLLLLCTLRKNNICFRYKICTTRRKV